MKIVLPSGSTGFINDAGRWTCTGSCMGRQPSLPDDPGTFDGKLYLQPLPFVDGDYDRWGAYWGGPATVWIAFAGVHWHTEMQGFARVPTQVMVFDVQLFVRANYRDEAKEEVLATLANARFYR